MTFNRPHQRHKKYSLMKRRIKIALWSVGSLIIVLFFFGQWYKQTYSMRPARQFEINAITLPHHILIATQGSNFKDSVVQTVIATLKNKPLYIKVIDISSLPIIDENEWNAIVILHTWEFSKPPEPAKHFIDSVRDRDKLIVLSTSGDGNFKIQNIDGITSASKLNDIPVKSQEILSRINKILLVQ